MSERRGDRNCGGTEPPDAGDNRRFRVCASVNRDGLAIAKPNRAATGITVAPTSVGVFTVVAPAGQRLQ